MEAIINPDELMDEVREQIPSVELTEGLIHEFKKITGLGQDAVENVDKRSTTDSADVKQSITIKPATDDEVSTKPVDGSQPAEFDATVKQMAYTVVKQSFGEKVYRSFHDYKSENVTQEDIEKFLRVLENPSKGQRNANIDELIALVEGENMKQFLKRFRDYHDSFRSYEVEDPYGQPPSNGLKVPKQDEQERKQWEPIMKRHLMHRAANGASKLPDDDYNFGKEYAEKLQVRDSDVS
ncbi:hypothetical protein EIK77_001103 [Talaromyces pinophilus]|nr:hypothetical protein EIK77_001103 [Talaromyces pinophilus]